MHQPFVSYTEHLDDLMPAESDGDPGLLAKRYASLTSAGLSYEQIAERPRFTDRRATHRGAFHAFPRSGLLR
jgi:hypothetical protein